MPDRARDLGLPFEGETGLWNAITDVAGVEVGLTTLVEGEGPVEVGRGPVRTGVTAILPRGRRERPAYVWAGMHRFNGNGEMTGTHWIEDAGYFLSPICITNTHSVGIAHHATVRWMIRQYPQFFQMAHNFAMPVVAETYDGVLNDICGLHLREEHVLQALDGAIAGPVAEGSVGGGTGMIAYEFKAGTGTASRRVTLAGTTYTVGALVQANFGLREDFMVLGVPVGRLLPNPRLVDQLRRQHETGSIIVVIGTDLPLSPTQLRRLAKRATLGMARTGTIGGHGSGDLFLAFSTANEIEVGSGSEPSRQLRQIDVLNEEPYIDRVYRGAVQAVEEAIINAIVAGCDMSTVKPAGFTVPGIDHQALRELMQRRPALLATEQV